MSFSSGVNYALEGAGGVWYNVKDYGGSLQNAYNDMVAVAEAAGTAGSAGLFCGTLYCPPGDYDVGSGLVFTTRRSIRIIGSLDAGYKNSLGTGTVANIYSSSPGTELFKLQSSDTPASQIYGFAFERLAFTLSGTHTAGIRGNSANHIRVSECSFASSSGINAYALEGTNYAGDNSWWTVKDNKIFNMGFLKIAPQNAKTNRQRWWVANNVTIAASSGGPSTICDIDTMSQSLFANNDIEWSASGITAWKLTRVSGCTFLNNTGEGERGDWYYDCYNCDDNSFIGGDCGTHGAAASGDNYIQFDSAPSQRNVVINPFIQDGTSSTIRKDLVTDNSSSKNNTVLGTNGFRYWTGAGFFVPTVSSDPGAGNGKFWYNTTTHQFRGYMNGTARRFPHVATSALATTATDGFLYVPTCAGIPTGVPASVSGAVALVYDTTNNNLYVYNTAWKKVALA